MKRTLRDGSGSGWITQTVYSPVSHDLSVKDSGKQIRVTEVCNMESKKDDSPPKSRFLEVRKEIHNR